MRPIGIALAPLAPRVADRARDLQRLFCFLVIGFELVEADRPVAAVAEPGLRLEPLRPPAQGDHGVVNGTSADPAAAVVGTELDRVGAAGDAVVGPKQAALRPLVGDEVLERPPEWPGFECDDGEAGFRELAGERSAASAGTDDREVDLFAIGIATHRHPLALPEDIGRMAVHGAQLGHIKHRHLRRRALRLPTGRARRNPGGRSRGGSPDRRNRFRSRRRGVNSRSRRPASAGDA